MPCPAIELGAIAPLRVVAILVAQAILPVPQVDWVAHVRNKEAKECVGLVLLRGAMLLLACSGTACRAATEETARAKRTMSRCTPSIGELRRVSAWGTGDIFTWPPVGGRLCYWKAFTS
jgi:hypothetical protein